MLDANGLASGGVSSELYVYDGADVWLDFTDADGPGGTATPEISHRYLHGPLVDQVLMQENIAGGSVTGVLWMLADNQGTVRDLVNSSGQHVEHIQYDSFGSIVQVTDGGGTPTSGPSTRYTYTGREWDAAVDMYFYRARWYDPHTGRFASEDPINLLGGDYNFYRYVGNSPTNGTDPSGLAVYRQNRQLAMFGREPREHCITHTFTYTTNPDGTLLHTYSWGNAYDDNSSHWYVDRTEDVYAAQTAIEQREYYSSWNWFDKMFPNGKGDPFMGDNYGPQVGDDGLNPYIERAHRILSQPGSSSDHPNLWITANCKDEATKLVNLAKFLRVTDRLRGWLNRWF